MYYRLLLLFYITVGYSQQDSGNNLRKLYINEEKYSIMFPSDWNLIYTDSLQQSFLLVSTKSNSEPGYVENIRLSIGDVGYDNVKPKFIRKLITKMIGVSSEILSDRTVKNGKIVGYEIVCKNLIQGMPVTMLIYVFTKKRDLYMLSFCSTPEEYLSYIPIVQNIIATFKIK